MKDEVREFLAFLDRKGFKVTRPRRAIAEVAFATHKHFTLEGLIRMTRQRDPSIGRVTVYRTHALMVEGGFIEKVSVADGPASYEHTTYPPHHDHMVCESCGRIINFRDETVERFPEEACRAEGFEPSSHILTIFGTCQRCQKQGPARPGRSRARGGAGR